MQDHNNDFKTAEF